MSDTVELRTSIRRDTFAKLDRLAKSWGLRRTKGGGAPYYGTAIDRILANVETQEPDYVRVAREAREERELKERRQNRTALV